MRPALAGSREAIYGTPVRMRTGQSNIREYREDRIGGPLNKIILLGDRILGSKPTTSAPWRHGSAGPGLGSVRTGMWRRVQGRRDADTECIVGYW